MAATSDSLLMVGILIGSYVFGDLADRFVHLFDMFIFPLFSAMNQDRI